MNCQEVQARLSDYLEKFLDAADLETMESHLSQCSMCRAEADQLKECIRYIAALPIVDPPIGFTQRVMAHLHEAEKQPRLWERLLFPLRIKIPIQATAVVMIGILAVYLLDNEPSQKPLPIKNAVSQPPLPRPEQSSKTPEPSPAIQQAPAKPSGLPVAGTPSFTRDFKAAQMKPVVANNNKTAEEQPRDSDLPTVAPIESRGRSGGIVGIPVANTGGGFGPLFSPADFDSSPFRSGPVSIEPFADYEIVLKLQSQMKDQARRDNSSLAQNPATRAVAGRPAAPGDLDGLLETVATNMQPQTVWVTVPKSQYEQLKKELRATGTIESEKQVPLLRAEPGAQTNGQLQIKLTVLPAPETDRTTPSSSNDR